MKQSTAHGSLGRPDPLGLLRTKGNAGVLKKCIKILRDLKDYIGEDGFDSEFDEQLLTRVYGDVEHRGETFFDRYRYWCSVADRSADEHKQGEDPSPKECAKEFLKELRQEITRLEQYRKASTSVSTEKIETEASRQNVPDSPHLEHLLGYEASLERAFDRILTQLERLQRMRSGQPVSAPIKVSLSSP